MKTRKLRDVEVSAVGYGIMGFSHGYGSRPSREEAIRLIRLSYDLGCTFFDTAEGYGNGENEELLGEAVRSFRGKTVIATKFNPIRSGTNLSKGTPMQQIEQRLDASLKRLGMDYVDIYYLHRITDDISVEEIAGVMGRFIEKGKIRGWGLSQADAEQIYRANAVTPLSAIQNEYSMMERMYEKEVIPACRELGIGFVPFSPMASGFLSGKYNKDTVYAGDDVRRVITRFERENVVANQPLLDMLNEFAERKKATPAQISLAWMLHKEDFIVPIPGMRKEERVKENLGAADVELTDAEYLQLEAELGKIEIHGNRTDEDIARLREVAQANNGNITER